MPAQLQRSPFLSGLRRPQILALTLGKNLSYGRTTCSERGCGGLSGRVIFGECELNAHFLDSIYFRYVSRSIEIESTVTDGSQNIERDEGTYSSPLLK
jgi:hypothetical protein